MHFGLFVEWQYCSSCPTTAASRMQRSAWGQSSRQEMGLRFSKSSGSGGTLRQLLDSTFGQICLFVSSPRKIFSNLCLCCLPMPVARRQHPISAVLLLAFPRKQPPSHPRCWTTLYGNPTIGDTATAHGWPSSHAPCVFSNPVCHPASNLWGSPAARRHPQSGRQENSLN